MNFSLLLDDILKNRQSIYNWTSFEDVVYHACLKQDAYAITYKGSDPDIILYDGNGIEVKSVSKNSADINLNSASPKCNVHYAIGLIKNSKIKKVAIVHGANYICRELDSIACMDTTLKKLSNNKIKYRARIMYQITSPFMTWPTSSDGFYVDCNGKITISV